MILPKSLRRVFRVSGSPPIDVSNREYHAHYFYTVKVHFVK